MNPASTGLRNGRTTGGMDMRPMIIGLGVSAAVALGLSMALMYLLCGGLFPKELLLGWGFALVNGWAAVILHRRAMRQGICDGLGWGLVGDAGRLAAAGALLLGRGWLGVTELIPLAISVVIGYLVFMINDVWLLHSTFLQETGNYD